MITNYDNDDLSDIQYTPTSLRPLKQQARNKGIEMDEKIDELETEILILRRQLPKLKDINGHDVTNEIMLLHEMIDRQRLQIENLEAAADTKKEQHQSFREEIEPSIVSEIRSSDRDDGEALIQVNKLKQLIQPLIHHLKSIIQYIKDVPGLSNHLEFQQLFQKILNVSVDLDTTMLANVDANGLESYNLPLMPQEKTSDQALMNEVNILRKRLSNEIALKQQFYDQLQDADHLRKRIQELVDEKQTLQEQLEELVDNEKDDEKLREALKDARDSLKRKSIQLKEAQKVIEDLSEQKERILNEYDSLQDDVDHNAYNVDQLVEAYQKMLVEAYQKMEADRNALEEELSKALKQNGINQGKYYEKYKDLKKYIKAFLLKLDEQTTEDPQRPPCIPAECHERLMNVIRSHSLETKTKFDEALEILKKIQNQDSYK